MPGLRGVYSIVILSMVLIPNFILICTVVSSSSGAPKAKVKQPQSQPQQQQQQHQQGKAPQAPLSGGRPDWIPPNPNEFLVEAAASAPYQYYEEPGQRPIEQDLEAMAAGNYPYQAFIGLNENGIGALPVTAEGEEPMLPQDFSDMGHVVEEDGEANSFFELPASIGQTAGLAVDANQNLVLFHRSSREWNEWSFDAHNRFNRSLGSIPNATIAVLDTRTGRVVGEYGRGMFYMPHGLSIDAQGNLWVTDVGSHQVMKLDAKNGFKPMLVVGEKLVPGSDEKHFCQPTDVAVARSGEFFVADGYCNARIMKFDRDGQLITTFGAPNSADPPKIGEFFVPHSLVLIEDLNLLCVADRENERIQCFAAGLNEAGGPSSAQAHHPRAYIPTGTFFTKAERIGRVFAIREKQHYLVGVTNNDSGSSGVDPQIFVMDMNTGRANTFAKGLENAHAVALSDQGDIYVSQMRPNQIVKFSVPSAAASAEAA